MAPPWPGMFSTTTGWPQAWEKAWAKMRPVMSVDDPAVKPTTSRTGRVGQACARAGAASSVAAANRPRRGTVMAFSPRFLVGKKLPTLRPATQGFQGPFGLWWEGFGEG